MSFMVPVQANWGSWIPDHTTGPHEAPKQGVAITFTAAVARRGASSMIGGHTFATAGHRVCMDVRRVPPRPAGGAAQHARAHARSGWVSPHGGPVAVLEQFMLEVPRPVASQIATRNVAPKCGPRVKHPRLRA